MRGLGQKRNNTTHWKSINVGYFLGNLDDGSTNLISEVILEDGSGYENWIHYGIRKPPLNYDGRYVLTYGRFQVSF